VVLFGVTPDGDDAPPPLLTVLPPGNGLEIVDLGLVGVAHGVTAEVLVRTGGEGDDAVRSFTVLVSAHDEASVVVDSVIAPDGSLVVSPDAPGAPAEASPQALRLSRGFAGPFLSPHRVLPKQGGGAFVFPATPDVPMVAGVWRVRVRQAKVDVDEDGTVAQIPLDRPVQLAVLFDIRVPATVQQLDVAFHFTGSRGLTATSAPGSIFVEEVQAALASRLRGADIEVNLTGVHDVEGDAGEEALQTVDLEPGFCDEGELRLLLQSLVRTPGSFDVVFVDRLRCVVRGDVVVDSFAGLAASVPGDVYVEGFGHGGVALATGVIGEDLNDVDAGRRGGLIVAHEILHLLGLFHTREQASGADPLIEDTIEDTDAEDEDNLMFFAPSGGALTAGQVFVARTCPWLNANP
jgi:hypothetical protein